MNKRVLMSMSDEMYSAIKVGYPDEPVVEHSVETLRAIQYCLEYLFVHIEYRGSREIITILSGPYAPLDPLEKSDLLTLSEELSKKVSVLNNEILQLVSDAYIAINIDRRVPQGDIQNHEDGIRAEIQDKINTYLEDTGGSQLIFNLFVQSSFTYLKLMAEAPQEDKIRRYELMHNFKGATMFMEHLFNLEG